MSKVNKVFEKVMGGGGDANIRFDDMCSLLERIGYQRRQVGSHVVFTLGASMINLQDLHGKVKPYQVRQAREQLKKFNFKP